ncbi:hypothetical protein FHS49_001897 [Sphingobium boeckii]|uniref:Uncharacterized protein n=1 Tax=Sphingobium boeckii TaxID=1082345 RepID=A0A7W9EFN4_9SPHN|nr:hypothetical protein [Sphingobium boeckii]
MARDLFAAIADIIENPGDALLLKAVRCNCAYDREGATALLLAMAAMAHRRHQRFAGETVSDVAAKASAFIEHGFRFPACLSEEKAGLRSIISPQASQGATDQNL